METLDFKIRFLNTPSGQANRWAGELKDVLLDVDPGVRVNQVRERSDTMDLGTILQVISSSVVLVQIVKSLEAWRLKRRSVAVEISDGDRTLKLSGVTEETAMAKVEAFFKQGEVSKDIEDA